MFFNSLDFAIFLPVVFILYWFAAKDKLKWQNILLLAASYFFYAYWDWRFLFLLIFSTGLDLYSGIKIAGTDNRTRRLSWLWLSIVINLGVLCVFKYFNFFADSFAQLVRQFGFKPQYWTLKLILPVGISFYTFHGLSYIIDVYRKKTVAERNFVDYAVFVSFFPLLVAGPIERATHLLPQIKRKRVFNYAQAVDGLRQILWGLFKKAVIADQCAIVVDAIFSRYGTHSGSVLVAGAVLFAFQIYGDFSGYSDIAIGTAKLFGIDLLRNFAYPYFSRDIAEFWRRWHISLSSWFRDYLYIPLGGSRRGKWTTVRNVLLIFVVSGAWHGANWTFIVWGILNALFILPSVILNTNRNNLDIVAKGRSLPTLKELLSIVFTFTLTTFAWIFFRSASVTDAVKYISKIFTIRTLLPPYFHHIDVPMSTIILLVVFVAMEWIGRESEYAIQRMALQWPKVWRRSFYVVLSFVVLYFAISISISQFIYFQF